MNTYNFQIIEPRRPVQSGTVNAEDVIAAYAEVFRLYFEGNPRDQFECVRLVRVASEVRS